MKKEIMAGLLGATFAIGGCNSAAVKENEARADSEYTVYISKPDSDGYTQNLSCYTDDKPQIVKEKAISATITEMTNVRCYGELEALRDFAVESGFHGASPKLVLSADSVSVANNH